MAGLVITKAGHHLLAQLAVIASSVPPIQSARIACALEIQKDIFIGVNQLKSHPLQYRFKDRESRIFMHAEIDAIRRALKKYSQKEFAGARMYLARVIKYNQKYWITAKVSPCNGCMAAINYFGIGQVICHDPGVIY